MEITPGGRATVTVNGHSLGEPGHPNRSVRRDLHSTGLPEVAIQPNAERTRQPQSLSPFGFGWPNVISLGRILLVPVVVWLLVVGSTGARWAAGIVFLAGAATDGVDGYLARRWDVKTRTGQWLDPLADKALVAAPIITLAVQGEFPVWAAVLILGREVAVVLLARAPRDAGPVDARVVPREGEDRDPDRGHHDVRPAAGHRGRTGSSSRCWSPPSC